MYLVCKGKIGKNNVSNLPYFLCLFCLLIEWTTLKQKLHSILALQNGKIAEGKRDGRNTLVALSVTGALPFLVLLLYIVVLF